MRNIVITTASAIVLATSAPAFAGFAAGDSSLQFGASGVYAQGADSATISGDISYGYFVTPAIELGVLQGLNYTIIDDADDLWSASTTGYANYNFGGAESRFVPFVGAFIGAAYNDDDITGTAGPQLGARVFVNETTFALVRYRYEWFFDDLQRGDFEDNASDGNHVVTVGLGFKF